MIRGSNSTGQGAGNVRWLFFRLVAQGDRAGLELFLADEFQVEVLRETREERWAVACEAGVDDELVFVDQSHFREREWELHAAGEETGAWLLLEPFDGLAEVAADELGVPVDTFKRAGDDVLLGDVDRLAEGDHPVFHPVGAVLVRVGAVLL